MIALAPFILVIFLLVILVILRQAGGRSRPRKSGGIQWETDLRLTYKRFIELYPFSEITYSEYKKLQAQKAYKRAVGSEKIKRMVR